MNLISTYDEVFNELETPEGALAFLGIFLMFLVFISLIAVAFQIVARWIYFRKCGKGGWEAIVPVYNEITLLKTAGMNWWWIFILYSAIFLSIINNIVEAYEGYVTYGWYDYTSPLLTLIKILISLVSLAASVFVILTKIGESINISKKFGKSGGYAALIFFFEPIMLLILGVSKNNKYDEKVKVCPNGLFGRAK